MSGAPNADGGNPPDQGTAGVPAVDAAPAAGAAPAAEAAAPAADAPPAAAPAAAADAPPAAAPDAEIKQPSETPTLLEEAAKEHGAKPADEGKAPAEGDKPPAGEGEPKADGDKPPATEAKPPAEGEKPPADGEKKPDAEVKPPEGEKPAEQETQAPAAVEYTYTLPETLTLNDEQKGELHQLFDSLRVNPTDGKLDVQPLIDYHNARLTEAVEMTRRNQFNVFNAMQDDLRKEVLADEQIGGNGHKTAMRDIAIVRDHIVSQHKIGSKEWKADADAFDMMMRVTGVGNWPVFLKAMHNAARWIKEPDAESMPANGLKPPPSNGVDPTKSRGARMYPNSNFPKS